LIWSYVGLIVLGIGYRRIRQRPRPNGRQAQPELVVQLRRATLPRRYAWVAVHYWFTVFDPADPTWRRWEVWQYPGMGGQSWAHVHRDMMHPDAGVGGGRCMLVREWRGATATRLVAAIHQSPHYPCREHYKAWPGPNSNTYVAWILREAGVSADLGPKAIGRDHLGRFGVALTTTRTGIQIESVPLGVKLGLIDGVEIHVLAITLGLDLLRPAIKSPFGRIGWPDA
jgi:hypothetical protein